MRYFLSVLSDYLVFNPFNLCHDVTIFSVCPKSLSDVFRKTGDRVTLIVVVNRLKVCLSHVMCSSSAAVTTCKESVYVILQHESVFVDVVIESMFCESINSTIAKT